MAGAAERVPGLREGERDREHVLREQPDARPRRLVGRAGVRGRGRGGPVEDLQLGE